VNSSFRPLPDAFGMADVTSQRQVIDIFLAPGDFFFGDEDTRIRTVLGSCVAITIWHPRLRIGGMCHYMLPTRGFKRGGEPDGRYGDEALDMFLSEVRRARTVPSEYEVKLFGGGNMFPHRKRDASMDVGRRNIEVALQLLESHRFHLKARHLAGTGHRNVVFEVWSGDVWMRHSEFEPNQVGEP
jgi:chemotaxis protein CheD